MTRIMQSARLDRIQHIVGSEMGILNFAEYGRQLLYVGR